MYLLNHQSHDSHQQQLSSTSILAGWIPFDLGPTATIPMALGAYALIFGLFSMVIKERLYLSEALVALAYGVIIGPSVLDLIDPADWTDTPRFTLEYSRFIIGIQVMAAGVTLPKKYIVRELKSLMMLLGPVMIWGWLLSGIILVLIFRISILEALLITSCIAPTDPVLANSVIQGKFAEKHVPKHVRDLISCESGANDGLGYPFLYFALYLLRYQFGEAISRWALVTLLWQIGMSIVIGLFVGWGARHLLRYSTDRGWIDKESFISFTIALTFFILGGVAMIGSDDILACFIAGNSLTWDDWFREQTLEAHFQEILDMLFNLSFFVYFGTIIPWRSYIDNPYPLITPARLITSSLMILVFKRLPAVLAISPLTPSLKTFRESVFTGWFGPSGVGSMFYCMVIYYEIHEAGPQDIVSKEVIFIIVTSTVVTSVIVHGITIPMLYLGQTIKKTRIQVPGVVNRALTPTAEFLESVLNKPYRRSQNGKAASVCTEPSSSHRPLLSSNADGSRNGFRALSKRPGDRNQPEQRHIQISSSYSEYTNLNIGSSR